MIEQTTMDMSAMMVVMGTMYDFGGRGPREPDRIYSNNMMSRMVNALLTQMRANNLRAFMAFIESEESGLRQHVNDIQYGYTTPINVFLADTSQGIVQVNPNTLFDTMGIAYMMDNPGAQLGMPGQNNMMGNMEVWTELHGNDELLASQYDILIGKMPQAYNEVVMIVDRRNGISDFALYSLGLMDSSEVQDIMRRIIDGTGFQNQRTSFSFEEILALEFKLVINTDFFRYENGIWVDRRDNTAFMTEVIREAEPIKVVGIIRPNENSVMGSPAHAVGYHPDLMLYLLDVVNSSEIVIRQKAEPHINVFTGRAFDHEEDAPDVMDRSAMTPQQVMDFMTAFTTMSDDEFMSFMMRLYMPPVRASFEENLLLMGVSDADNPSSIYIYPKDFNAKDEIIAIINAYNNRMEMEGKDDYVIRYTDFVGLLMSSVSTIINSISYVLIAFVAISLVVSSIMIGIITYISVLERTKEIGILRSIGASKRDISLVFNAETISVGLVAGVIGIASTLLLCIPANIIIENLSGIVNVAVLPVRGAVILVVISVILTLIAGLIPSKIAAKKDPVVALRTE
jgi:putative ABC transport system permease protein